MAHERGDAWLLVIDPQAIFADPGSQWCAPRFNEIVGPVQRLATHFGERVIVTRWLPGTNHKGGWRDYFERWAFADRPNDDPLFVLVPAAQHLTGRPTVDVSTFGKYGEQLLTITGPNPHLVLTGVATDCCVISTALAAADDGAIVTVVSDAVAGSSDENQAAALQIMGLYDPQILISSTELVLQQ